MLFVLSSKPEVPLMHTQLHVYGLRMPQNMVRINSNTEVCAFIDKYITCETPDNNEMLKELVLTLQQHKQSFQLL